MAPTGVLLHHLEQLTRRLDHIYIILDALDESPRHNQRDGVLRAIETMRNWQLPGLHVLVTSRDEVDIRESLNPTQEQRIHMRNAAIENDISNYVHGKLKTDRKLYKWNAYHEYIQEALVERAQGV